MVRLSAIRINHIDCLASKFKRRLSAIVFEIAAVNDVALVATGRFADEVSGRAQAYVYWSQPSKTLCWCL